MKKLFLAMTIKLGVLISTQPVHAWVETAPTSKSYSFTFNYDQQSLSITKEAGSYEEALDIAASECFRHFKKNKKVSYEKGLEIIDICANPRK